MAWQSNLTEEQQRTRPIRAEEQQETQSNLLDGEESTRTAVRPKTLPSVLQDPTEEQQPMQESRAEHHQQMQTKLEENPRIAVTLNAYQTAPNKKAAEGGSDGQSIGGKSHADSRMSIGFMLNHP